MNRIFSKVWSKALGRLVVASELASRQGSGTSRGATVSAGPINRSLLGAAVVAAMMGLPTEVLAGNGIHINSGSDGECVSINEPGWSPFTQTQTQLLNNNINFKDTDPKCGAFPNSPNGVLFYRPAAVDGVGATSLGLGGDLWVNGKVSLNPTGLARIDVKSLAFGLNATATNANDWAIGEGAKADSAEKRDAETGAAGNALAIGNNSLAEHTEALALGLSTRARAPLSTAVGRSASIGAGGHSATAVGRFAQANGHSTTAIGRDTIARAEQSTAVGYGARTGNNASRAVAIGASAQAIGLESLAMGSGAMVSAGMNNAVAIGKDSRGNAADTVAIGVGAVAEHFNSVALGTAARTAPHRVVSPTDLNGTRYNFLPPGLAEANVNGVVSVGSEAVSRQLVNVAPGVLDATSYDAVNGSQLFAAYQEINKLGQKDVALAAKDAELEDRLNKLPKGIDGATVAAAIGPGTQVDGNGRLSLPQLALKSLGRQPDDVTVPAAQPTSLLGAIDALDGEMVKINGALGVLFDNALLWHETEGAYSAQKGAAPGANRIANVAAGTGTQDAVNVGQLREVERTAQDAGSAASTAQRAADAAQATADQAKAAAGSASTQLAGIGPQETVAGRIKDAGQSVANALGGGASANADGTVSAPSYGVAAINADGSIGEVTQHGNVGGALTALDQNIGTVNERVDGLARDSLRWNEDLGAYDAARDGQASSQIANVAAGVKTTDAVNVGQLNVVDQAAKVAQSAAQAAQFTADGAQRTADGAASAASQAQATADSAASAANAAAADAGNAQRAADAAQVTANEAKAAAGAANTQLAGIGPQETVAGRIKDAGQSVADALGGGASANADGSVSAPSYGVAAINADGSTGEVTQHGNVGGALGALDQNIGTVNDRVDGLARDSLRWNEDLGAYDAAHDGQASSQIANVAAGVKATDAVNVGQLNTVDQAAKAAQSAAQAAQSTADAAGVAAYGAQRTADGAASAANQAQATADSAVNAAAAAATDAGNAQRAADAAQVTANEAKAAAGSASTQLAGIGPQETVAGRIKDAGQSVANALGGGASANADGSVSAPSYGVAAIDADGSVGEVTQHGNVGGALSALNQNIGTVNDRVDGLARDSLRWNEDLGAYDAAHDGQASSQIANVAAGVKTTDAVNVGQLNTVDQAAKAAQSAAQAAQSTADAAGVAADGAQRTADGAASAANRAQATADSAASAAAAAATDAGNAQRAADAAQVTANEAKAAAGAANTQLAGIGPQETVAGRIKDAGQSVADALGGGASANADGSVSAPSYGVAAINADGSTGEVTQHGNVGGALTALDQNIGTVNDRVDGLARDSLRWNEDLGAYDAAHDGQASSQIANVAAGVKTTDAVNVGQLNTVDQAAKAAQSAAQAAQSTADGATSAANQAQATADSAVTAAAAAATDAGNAQRAADAAQVTANEARAVAGAASTQLAGIGPQETVAGRIKDAGQSVANALGGGVNVNADGTVSAPSYGVAAINADGSTGEVTQHGNVGGALNALDQNIGTVNDRVDGLARDSLRWNENLGAYDAAHDGQASSQIANVAAGVKTTDAVNVSQLNVVDQAAQAAQSVADAASSAADGAQRTADDATARAATAQATADRVGGVASAALQAANSAGEGVIRTAAEVEQTRNQIVRGEIGLVKKDPQSKSLTIGKDTGGNELDVSGHEGGRRVTGIAVGRIDDASTDAVTGAQLNALDKRVQRADALGEGVAVDRPSSEQPAARAEVGSGAVAVGAGTSASGTGSVAVGQGAATTGAQATALGKDAVASAPGSVALGAGSRADRPNALSVGAAGAERQITHVAPATRDTDAVNLGQARSLSRQEASWALVQANGYTDRQIKQLRREANAGIALSMSMAGLPSSFVPGGRMIAMAGSTYGGESAVALGFSAVSEDGSFMLRASGSTTTEDHGFTIGVGFQW
ncbi:hypothetical protein QEK94_000085 [Stenotrophomonas maltophilia]|uniref:ESPR-type extended signal peptide-containing protein n=8 Tax=Gammaproteobacteria TaxID=1236 RepID=UPI001EDA2875|nr:ESPR-type extended signal peptide-containing protein [Stenotrophomonas maltophilia]EKT4444555.1 hypothetical protein [Stenotrophomonas maltophilia]UKJ27656.1 hypothetical protein L6173_10185 [Stenotrophomonas maltophilia]HDS1638176.1 hypothetical protein [Stenotrophomonas maltophilia]